MTPHLHIQTAQAELARIIEARRARETAELLAEETADAA